MKKLLFLITTFVLLISATRAKAEAPPAGYVSLFSLNYISLGETDKTGAVVGSAASLQVVGPANGWGSGSNYYDISKYDSLAIKLTVNPADAGHQGALRIAWNGAGVTVYKITYPADSSTSFVYKISLAGKKHLDGMVFYNGATHWSISYDSTAASHPTTIDYIALKTIPATGVALADTAVTIGIGSTTTLAYSMIPTTATNDSVTWTSSANSVATVINGVVTATGTGSAIIKATSVADTTLFGKCTVTVTPYPTNYVSLFSLNYISLGETDKTGAVVGSAASLQVVGPANGWGSGSNYYPIANYDTLAIKLTVNPADAGHQGALRIAWNGAGVTVYKITYPADSSTSVVYKISLAGKKHLDGMVFYNGATHWSISYDSTAASHPTTIDYIALEKVTATGLAITPADSTLAKALPIGKSTTLNAVFTPTNATYNTVTWESLNPNIASVDQSGLVTASADSTGAAIIKVTSVTYPTFSATYTVNVITIPITSVAFADTAVTLEIGKTAKLAYSVLPTTTTENDSVTWTSSADSVATVVNGVVTAVGRGSTTIKVTSVADTTKFGECTVTVTPYPTNYVSLFSLNYISLGETDKTGAVVGSAASLQVVGPANGWGSGSNYYAIANYDTLAVKLTVNPADAGHQGALRIAWDGAGVTVYKITYPADSSTSVVYKISLAGKKHLDGMVFYNGATHWSISYDSTAASHPTTIDYIALEKVTATGLAITPTDSTLAQALPLGQSTTLNAVFAPTNATYNSVTWESLDTNIATVDQSGVVTASADSTGAVIIKVTSVTYPAFSATYTVKVIPTAVGIIDVKQDQDSIVNVYSISGIMLRKAVKYSEATEGLEKGIYIVGHKKILVTK